MIIYGLLMILTSASAQTSDFSTLSPEAEEKIEFSWIEADPRLNCVVGISVKNKSVSAGVYISSSLVLTSSNPLRPYKDHKEVTVHSIYGSESLQHKVECIVHLKRSADWVVLPHDNENSPVHDLAIIGIAKETWLSDPELVKNFTTVGDKKVPFPVEIFGRTKPFFQLLENGTRVPEVYPTEPGAPMEPMSAGFAFSDREHVQRSQELDTIAHAQENLVDCDEYIPRYWGNFICILDKDNYKGIQSGQPLFSERKIVGIGSFTIKKGKEIIYFFTNTFVYADSLPTKCNPK